MKTFTRKARNDLTKKKEVFSRALVGIFIVSIFFMFGYMEHETLKIEASIFNTY